MKKLNITKERFEKSRYFQKKYGTLKYVSESGNLYKTDKGKVLKFVKEYADGYEGIYGHPADGTWDADRQFAQDKQIESGVVIYRTNRLGDLWTIKTVDGDLRLKEGIKGFNRAMKLAKKNGWKVVKTIPKDPTAFNESIDDLGDIDTFRAIHDRELDSMISDGIEEKSFLGIRGLNKGTYAAGEKFLQWKGKELLYDDFEAEIQERFPEAEGDFEAWIHDPKNKMKIKGILPELDWVFNDEDIYWESTKKFGRKFTKENVEAPVEDLICPRCGCEDIYVDAGYATCGDCDYSWEIKDYTESVGDVSTDPAYVCPYCGSRDCEFDDAEEIGTGLTEGYFDGATFNAQFWCNECNKPYNVTYELKVKDVYPNEDIANLEDDDL